MYQRDDLFDPMYVDLDSGMTNLELMKKGNAPKGIDGESVNLHHSIQADDSPIVELSKTMHIQYSNLIHINPSTIPSGVDRSAFDNWRKKYWRARARDIEQGIN